MRKKRPGRLWISGLVGAICLLSWATAGAASANLSRSYFTHDSLEKGSLVSLDPNRADFVEAASTANGKRLLGVSVGSNESLLAVDEMAGKTQVATGGTVSALVSDLNGKIKVGDQISVSPFKGIGSKALPGAYLLGLAQTSFDKTESGAHTVTITDKQGGGKRLTVGYIRLSIAIGPPPAIGSIQTSSLQKFVQSLTGHRVSTTRVVISVFIAILTLIGAITLLYGAIYGGIISVGRNPLAKHAIFRSLASVLAMVGAMSIVSASLIYLLLH